MVTSTRFSSSERFRRAALFGALCTVLCPRVLQASVAADIGATVGGGSDAQLFRLATAFPSTIGDRYGEARARAGLSLWSERGDRLRVDYVLAGREFASSENGHAIGHLGSFDGLWRFSERFGLAGAGFATTEHFSNVPTANTSSAGGGLALALLLEKWRIELGADVLGVNSETFHAGYLGPSLFASVQLGRLGLAARGQVLMDGATVGQVNGTLSGNLLAGDFVLGLAGSASRLEVGGWLSGLARVEYLATDACTLEAGFRVSHDQENGTTAIAYNGWLGVRFRVFGARRPVSGLLSLAQTIATPNLSGDVELVVHAPLDVRSVAITGDFSDWSPSGVPLERIAPGTWRMRLKVTEGRYAYQLVVDGVMVVPHGAPLVDDEFGGKNAVLIRDVTTAQHEVSIER